MERWYRQGAIVLWPRDRTFRILAAEGQKTALPELEKRAARAKRPEALAECRSLAAEIVAHWQPRQQSPQGEKAYPGRMLHVLERIGATDLVERFVANVLPDDYDGSEGQTLLRLCELLGWRRLVPALCGLIARQKPDDFHSRLDQLVALCKPLCCDPPPMTDERRAACSELAAALAEAVERWDKKPAGTYYGSSETRKGVVDGMVRILAALSDARAIGLARDARRGARCALRSSQCSDFRSDGDLWLACRGSGRGAGCPAVAGALPDGIAHGHGRAGPGPGGLGPRGRPWLQVRGLPGLGRLLARSGSPRWDVFRSARTGGSTCMESSTAATATARTSPSAKARRKRWSAPRPRPPTSGGSNNSTATWSRSSSWNRFPPWGIPARPSPNGHRHGR